MSVTITTKAEHSRFGKCKKTMPYFIIPFFPKVHGEKSDNAGLKKGLFSL
jgi:hypothetical protein